MYPPSKKIHHPTLPPLTPPALPEVYPDIEDEKRQDWDYTMDE